MTIQVPSITELELDSTLQSFFKPELGLGLLNDVLLNEKCLQTDDFKKRSPSINPFVTRIQDEKQRDDSNIKVVSLFPPLKQRQISPRYRSQVRPSLQITERKQNYSQAIPT